jgi:hypothetical protein
MRRKICSQYWAIPQQFDPLEEILVDLMEARSMAAPFTGRLGFITRFIGSTSFPPLQRLRKMCPPWQTG